MDSAGDLPHKKLLHLADGLLYCSLHLHLDMNHGSDKPKTYG